LVTDFLVAAVDLEVQHLPRTVATDSPTKALVVVELAVPLLEVTLELLQTEVLVVSIHNLRLTVLLLVGLLVVAVVVSIIRHLAPRQTQTRVDSLVAVA
jgi:hypothetical protein